MQAKDTHIIDPKTIQDVQSFEWIAKKLASGFLHGKHNSSRLGVGMEFQQYRPYVAGDDIRGIDWKMFAKTDKFYIKQTHIETEQRFSFYIDNSASMKYEEEAWSKFLYSKLLAAAMMHILSNQGDYYQWQSGEVIMPFGSGKRHWQHCIEALYHLQEGTNVLPEVISSQDAISIFISDFYFSSPEIERLIKNLKNPKSELILFHILGRAEKELDFGSNMTFVDLETSERIEVNSEKSRRDYIKRLSAHIRFIKQRAFEQGAMYEELMLNGDIRGALQKFFHYYQYRAIR